MRAWVYAGILGLGLALGGAPSSAAPITYLFVSGDVTLVASQDNSILAGPVNVALSGVSVTVDTAALALNSLTFTVGSTGSLTLSPDYAGYDTFNLDGAIVSGTSGALTFVALGPPDEYGFTITASVTGQFDASSPTDPAPPNINNAPFTLPSAAASGTIFVDGNDLYLTSFTIGEIDPDGPGGEAPLLVKGDFVFVGVVPEPTTAMLLGGGLVALAGVARRRSA
jgi:hypothetical protein